MVTTSTLATILLNGLAQAMLLFLVASGLTIIFGMVGIVNFAHGVFYALGAYFTFVTFVAIDNFWLAVLAAAVLVALIGLVIERVLLKRIYDHNPMYQVLLTFGIAVVIEQLIRLHYGTGLVRARSPPEFSGATDLGLTIYPTYRLFIIFVGIVTAIGIWALFQKTKTGIVLRAGQIDRELVRSMGYNVNRYFAGIFAFGVALAAISGILAGPIYSVRPEMGVDILVPAFVVVVVGGMGSVKGSFVGAIIIGIAEATMAYYYSRYAGVVMFVIMAAVLLTRPYGVYGKPGLFEH